MLRELSLPGKISIFDLRTFGPRVSRGDRRNLRQEAQVNQALDLRLGQRLRQKFVPDSVLNGVLQAANRFQSHSRTIIIVPGFEHGGLRILHLGAADPDLRCVLFVFEHIIEGALLGSKEAANGVRVFRGKIVIEEMHPGSDFSHRRDFVALYDDAQHAFFHEIQLKRRHRPAGIGLREGCGEALLDKLRVCRLTKPVLRV